MSQLSAYVDKQILVLTADGRTITGTLSSYDTSTNLVLTHTIERVIRPPDDPEANGTAEHGLYVIRGDNVMVVGLVDGALDASIDWKKVRGGPLRGIKNA